MTTEKPAGKAATLRRAAEDARDWFKRLRNFNPNSMASIGCVNILDDLETALAQPEPAAPPSDGLLLAELRYLVANFASYEGLIQELERIIAAAEARQAAAPQPSPDVLTLLAETQMAASLCSLATRFTLSNTSEALRLLAERIGAFLQAAAPQGET